METIVKINGNANSNFKLIKSTGSLFPASCSPET